MRMTVSSVKGRPRDVFERKGIPMLFFGRKVGEGFVIGGNVKVTITEVKGKRVRVSIDAPVEIDVFRTEIQERLNAGMEKAKRPDEAAVVVPLSSVVRIGERLPGELMRRKP